MEGNLRQKVKTQYIYHNILTTTIYSARITMKVDLCSPQTAHTFCSGPNARSAGQGGFLKPGHHISARDTFVSV